MLKSCNHSHSRRCRKCYFENRYPVSLEDFTPLILERLALTDMTLSDLARSIGAVNGKNRTDVTRVKRMLGLVPHSTYQKSCTRISAYNAARIARAVGLDPVDVGV